LQQIHSAFLPPGTVKTVAPFGSGHINSSYRVTTAAGNYLLQRINHQVFPDVPALTSNIRLVTDHIRTRITAASGEASEQLTLRLVPTLRGDHYHRDADGHYWRMFNFLDGLLAYDLVETPEQAYAGARSFGYFLRFLTDFPPERVVPILPDFHNVVHRLNTFNLARAQVQGKLKERGRQCQPDIARVISLSDGLTDLQQAWEAGTLPTRITHNDTKFNNVLLSPDGRGKAVIDLDTVMPGIVHFDFGDGIRTGTATAEEDEADQGLVGVDPEKYRAFQEGYLSVTSDFLTDAELHYLPRSGALLAYIMGVRFLTDYLMGDTYYGAKYPEHNLVRARNQLQMAEKLREFTGT
jgi:Ser/Thr protein kinase RdoA (MazF antagonist)